MKNAKLLVFVCVAAALAAVVGFVFRPGAAADASPDAPSDATGGPDAPVARAAGAAEGSTLYRMPRPTRGRTPPGARAKPTLAIAAPAEGEEDDPDDRESWPPAERQLAEKIEKALDDEDFNLAISCAGAALSSANTEIRQSMVDTLGWFGSRAIPELTPFLADADDDVRDSALMEWSSAVSDIEDDAERIKIVELAMQALADEDQLEDISNEYFGVDEALAVDSLLHVIEAGGTDAGIAKAKETYEFVTGEEFTNRADAEQWVREQADETAPDEQPGMPVSAAEP